MQQQEELAASAISPSFAGMLAALAAPVDELAPAWEDDGLQDDVATFSFSALRAETARTAQSAPLRAAHPAAGSADSEIARAEITAPDRNLKYASITIRLSQAECAQLRERAAEAGLAVSGYLRSCIFEVESLRGQVKETLAQLRSASPSGRGPAAAPDRRFWVLKFWVLKRLAQLRPHLHGR